jgi:hypothetical protein
MAYTNKLIFGFLILSVSLCIASDSYASIEVITHGFSYKDTAGNYIIGSFDEKQHVSNGNTFLRLQDTQASDDKSTEWQWGYNTTAAETDITGKLFSYDETKISKTDTLNQDFQPSIDDGLGINEVPTITVAGVDYRYFLLEVNQNGGEANYHQITNIRLGVTLSDVGANITDWATQVTEVLSINENILINGQLQGGTNADMYLLVKDSLFDVQNATNIALFAAFDKANDGPDRWFYGEGGDGGFGGEGDPVPEPGTIAIWSMIGLGAVGGAAWRRRRQHA